MATDPWMAAYAGTTAIGTGVLGYLGAQEANQLNAEQFWANQTANQEIIRSGREFARDMSNTAHQREIQDLQKAGLNPVLSAMGGGGASTPNAGGSAAGVGNPAQNELGQLGEGLTKAVTSAMNAMSTIENVKNVQADTALKAMQAITEQAKADRETWNARSLMEDVELKTGQRKKWDIERDATREEAKTREKKALQERDNLKLDKFLEQFGAGTGIIRDATESVGALLYPWRLMKQDQYRHEDRMLKGYKAK